jgi:hypothetical protein
VTARRIPSRFALALAACLAVCGDAAAGPWLRDRGHGYLNLSYGRIAATGYYGLDGKRAPLGQYEQHAGQLYGELGLIDRWLMATVEWQAFRWAQLMDGATYGTGDLRLGFWSGLVTAPVRLSAAVLLGVPIGDPAPTAPPGSDQLARELARSLPTGDGEFDIELRLSLGYSFGGKRRWPLEHFLIVEGGYWGRTASFDHRGNQLSSRFCQAFTGKVEVGAKLPWTFIERFWFVARMPFVVSEQVWNPGCLDPLTPGLGLGLGNGVSFIAYGFEVAGRIVKGLGAGIGLDSAFYARNVLAGYNLKVGLSYEF